MTWCGIEGHDRVVERFRQTMRRNRLAGAYLFTGPPGAGKATFARKLAQALLCSQPVGDPSDLIPCNTCDSCTQVLAGTHPDLEQVRRLKDKSVLQISQFVGDKDHRMQEGLCHRISLKPMCGGRKVAIIEDADYFNQESANCLLKTLEEPPPRSVIILIATSEQTQLPTIRSRCQTVRFSPLEDDVVARLLVEHNLIEEELHPHAAALARLADGSLDRAVTLAGEDLRVFRKMLLKQLSSPTCGGVAFAKDATEFVNGAGKDAPPRRERLRHLLDFAIDFYRNLMLQLEGAGADDDKTMQAAVQNTLQWWKYGAEAATVAIDRCLEARRQIDANVQPANVLEVCLSDLLQIYKRGLAPQRSMI